LVDIARSNDLETGNPLFTWLADQFGKSTDSLERGTIDAHEKEEECERRTRAEMTEVALEPEEVLMFVRYHHWHLTTNRTMTFVQAQKYSKYPPEYTHSSAEYMPPSRLQYVPKVAVDCRDSFDNLYPASRRNS